MKLLPLLLLLFILPALPSYAQSPILIKDLYPGTDAGFNEDYRYFIELDGRVVTVAREPETGLELYVLDGDELSLLKDIAEGPVGSDPEGLTLYKGKIYFSANAQGQDRELWVTDGTEAGTEIFKDIKTGSLGSFPRVITVSNDGYLFFHADNKMFVSDGSPDNTAPLSFKGYVPAYENFIGDEKVIPFKEGLVFHSGDSDSLYVYRTQGACTSPALVLSMPRINPSDYLSRLTEVNSKLVFYYIDPENEGNNKVYAVSGDQWEAPQQLSGEEALDFQSVEFIHLDSERLIILSNEDKLYVTDATQEGTLLLKKVSGGPGFEEYVTQGVLDGRAYFVLESFLADDILYSSDGTPEGTKQEKVLEDPYSHGMASHKGSLFFATGIINGLDPTIFQIDAVTKEIEAIYESPGMGATYFLGFYKDELYFQGDLDPSVGSELYKIKPDFSTATNDAKAQALYSLRQSGSSNLFLIGGSEPDDIKTLQLFDLQGRRVWSGKVAGEGSFQPDVSGGTYFLQLTGRKGRAGFSIVVMN